MRVKSLAKRQVYVALVYAKETGELIEIHVSEWHRSVCQKHEYAVPSWRFLTVVVPVHICTAENNIVAVVITLRSSSTKSSPWSPEERLHLSLDGVENYLRNQPDKTDTKRNKSPIGNKRESVPETCLVYAMGSTSRKRCGGESTLPRENEMKQNQKIK